LPKIPVCVSEATVDQGDDTSLININDLDLCRFLCKRKFPRQNMLCSLTYLPMYGFGKLKIR